MASRQASDTTPRQISSARGSISSVSRVREITVESLVQASKLTVGKTEHLDQYLKRVTHLTLPGDDKKVIKRIQLLERCPHLKVLYMYDNEIEQIENLDRVPELTHLHLQNNWITAMENLDNLPHLEKLYIEGNRISRLQGLDKCLYLQELHMSNQKLSRTAVFTFEDSTLRALARSLLVLNLANSHVQSVQPLTVLRGLQQLDLSKNTINDLDDVIDLLRSLSSLVELDLRENPVTQVPKYREKAMTFSTPRLMVLDKKDIDANQRRMMQTHLAHKYQKRQEAEAPTSNQPLHSTANVETIRKLKHGSSVHQLRSGHVAKTLSPQWDPDAFGVAGSSCSTAMTLSTNNNNNKHL